MSLHGRNNVCERARTLQQTREQQQKSKGDKKQTEDVEWGGGGGHCFPVASHPSQYG